MKLYDAHSHLHFPENADALRALAGNSDLRVCDCAVSEKDLDDLRGAAQFSRGVILPAYGIHPLYIPRHVRDFPKEELAEFLNGAAALGEVGLDKKADTDYETQKECFEIQLDMALAFGLPAVLHCRGAWGDMLEILKARPLPRGVLVHAANCSPEIARELLPLGAVFSFGMRELGGLKGLNCAASLPVERILIESDADSDKALLEETLSTIADLKGENIDDAARIIEDNFLRFFNV
jgi:Mg-dependent DNase